MPSTSRLPYGVDGSGDHDADLGDAALLAHPLGERVEPEVAVRTAVERPLEEARDDAVELGADARHLALGDAFAAQGAHEVVDPACRDALDVRLLHDRQQRALGSAEPREALPSPQEARPGSTYVGAGQRFEGASARESSVNEPPGGTYGGRLCSRLV